MKRIGLLGGMSWESSIEYERIINEGVRARLGGSHSADLVIRSYDFAAIEALQEAGDWEAAGALLAADARTLQLAGAEIIVLCTNTMHVVAPMIEAALDIEFLHIAEARLPRGDRPTDRAGCNGGDCRLHRDRTSRHARRCTRTLLPNDPTARRGGGRGSAVIVALFARSDVGYGFTIGVTRTRSPDWCTMPVSGSVSTCPVVTVPTAGSANP